MREGKLRDHIILNPEERAMAIEALRLENCDELADMLQTPVHKEIPPSAALLIMGGMKKMADMDHPDAYGFMDECRKYLPKEMQVGQENTSGAHLGV